MAVKSLSAYVGRGWKLALDESWHHEKETVRAPDRRWYEQVPVAGGGFVCLYSETPVTLKLWTQRVRNANHIAKKLGPQVEVIHLDGEVELLFPQALAQEVLEMAGGAKRRIYTPVERAKLAERLAKAREKSPIGNRASNPLESSTANLEEVVNG